MAEPLAVVTWKWHQPGFRGGEYTAEHVNVLAASVARHYRAPHRFICVTDEPAGLAPGVEAFPLWPDHADLPNPNYRGGPSCYRRLRAFSSEAADWFGPRLVSLDLDVIITGDLAPLWNRPEDFVIWGGPMSPGQVRAAGHWYNGSMWLLRSGTRPQVWSEFDPDKSPAEVRRSGGRGSDQAWMYYILGWGEATWTQADGVVSFRRHIKANPSRLLPQGTRVVVFNGQQKPWGREAQVLPWVRRYWRGFEPLPSPAVMRPEVPLTIITFLFDQPRRWREAGLPAYTPAYANALRLACAERIAVPHRFVTVAERARGLAGDTLPLWPPVSLNGEEGCYRRLRAFSSEFQESLGSRYVMCLDLDVVLWGDITALVEDAMGRDFSIVRGSTVAGRLLCPYNGSMWVCRTGARSHAWTSLTEDPAAAAVLRRGLRVPGTRTAMVGTDQAWLAAVLPGEFTLGSEHGVIQYRDLRGRFPPPGTSLVCFAGTKKPWSPSVRSQHPEVAHEWYRFSDSRVLAVGPAGVPSPLPA